MSVEGHVYWIGVGQCGPVKVGFSRRPWQRLAELQCASPFTLEMESLFTAPQWVEFYLHRVLAGARRRGEWFARDAVDALFQELLVMHDRFGGDMFDAIRHHQEARRKGGRA